MAGQDDPKMPGSLAAKSAGIRLLVLSAGSLMNALLPLILFSVAFMLPHDTVIGRAVVEEVEEGSPAAVAGIEAGDTIIRIGDKEIDNTLYLSRYIQLNLGKETSFLVKHSDLSQEEVRLVPRWKPPLGQGATGITVRTVEPTIVREQVPIWQAVPMGINQCLETFVLFKNAILGLFLGTTSLDVAGPVGIAQLSGEAAQAGISPLLEFAAFLSINLAIINMLPLPALDGGRVMFVLLEWLRRGKRISPQKEGQVHVIGFIMLMAFILAVTYQDIIRIMSGESIIP